MNYNKRTVGQDVKGAHTHVVFFLILSYTFLYEWSVFDANLLHDVVNVAKLVIPVILFILVPSKKLYSRNFKAFIVLYFLFMAWAFIPSIFASDWQESIVVWLKYLPRALFALLVGSYFLKQPQASVKLIKCVILIGVATIAQFVLLAIYISLGYTEGITFAGAPGLYFGPLGILGNQAAWQSFEGIPFIVYRLTGFWAEPSNASGFLFVTFFLARAMYDIEKKRFWSVISYICLVGGFLGLSNAGYLAISAPTLFACLFMKKSGKKVVYAIVLGALSLGLGYFAVRGRALVADSYSNTAALRALSGYGARTSGDDMYGGRLELMKKNFDLVIDKPFGIGLRIPGDGHYEDASASAPVLWLAYTGLIGIILLLFREYQVARIAIKYSGDSTIVLRMSQAWIALFTQNLVYGTWMTPMYLLLCVLVFSMSYHVYRSTEAQPALAKPLFRGFVPVKI